MVKVHEHSLKRERGTHRKKWAFEFLARNYVRTLEMVGQQEMRFRNG